MAFGPATGALAPAVPSPAPAAPPPRPPQFLGFACVTGALRSVALPAVVGIPAPSSVVLDLQGAANVFVVGLSPQVAQTLEGQTLTACGPVFVFFGFGPFAGQTAVGIVPSFLFAAPPAARPL